MQGRGYTFDYISDKQLQQTDTVAIAAGSGQLDVRTSGDAHYQTVLLPACSYLSNGAMDKLIGLAEGGASILVYKQLPTGPSRMGLIYLHGRMPVNQIIEGPAFYGYR